MSTARTLYEREVEATSCGRVMASIRAHEGYRGQPYKDTLGKLTIGVGTLLPLTEDEAMLLAYCRMQDSADELGQCLYDARHLAITDLPWDVRYALVEMAFQLGVPRFMGFRKMIDAIKERRWKDAAAEALDSRWARQTPTRAEHVAAVFRACAP